MNWPMIIQSGAWWRAQFWKSATRSCLMRLRHWKETRKFPNLLVTFLSSWKCCVANDVEFLFTTLSLSGIICYIVIRLMYTYRWLKGEAETQKKTEMKRNPPSSSSKFAFPSLDTTTTLCLYITVSIFTLATLSPRERHSNNKIAIDDLRLARVGES